MRAAFKILLLGCGAAAPNLRFMTTAQAVHVHGEWVLLDAGEGVQVALRKHKVPFGKVDHVFISHMHGDHVLGLPGLVGSMNLLGRTTPLWIHGPAALEPWLMEGLRLTATYLQFPIHFEVHPEGLQVCAWSSKHYEVLAFPTRHRVPTHGFLVREFQRMGSIRRSAIDSLGLTFEEIRKLKAGRPVRSGKELVRPEDVCEPGLPARSYAFAADSRPSDDVVEAVRGVDCLYHEATFRSDLAARARDTGHSTAAQAGRVAEQAGVSRLVLGHFSGRYKDLSPLLIEAQACFERTELGFDGMVIDLA